MSVVRIPGDNIHINGTREFDEANKSSSFMDCDSTKSAPRVLEMKVIADSIVLSSRRACRFPKV